jgi:hypothetical protein
MLGVNLLHSTRWGKAPSVQPPSFREAPRFKLQSAVLEVDVWRFTSIGGYDEGEDDNEGEDDLAEVPF